MSAAKPTIGQAIDQIVEASRAFEAVDQITVLSTVCTHLKISLNPTPANVTRQPAPDEPHRLPPSDTHLAAKTRHGLDIRTLKEEKQPKSARQMACIVAYYLLEHAPEGERKDMITTADVEKYFKQAGFKLPSKLEQLLIDSKGSGYFESPSRGFYKLTRVGYNLVTHSLPAKGAA